MNFLKCLGSHVRPQSRRFRHMPTLQRQAPILAGNQACRILTGPIMTICLWAMATTALAFPMTTYPW
ncbi:hypothetical protein EMPG_13171 [Blastomyces silverae]|uniref:Uncharacterized protein n=1 Tax=Blastomyces silverae TaxID=2060906 RepID=A0A0H1BR29_9EURO|nr:hypothetical protein EMPG_13171 [Blastomyces silverae]